MANNEELLPFCECGKCGLRVTKKGNKFRHGHNPKNGKNNPMYGKKHSPETIILMSEIAKENPPFLGKKHLPKSIKLMSENQMGENNSFYGKEHAQESKLKISTTLKSDNTVFHHHIYDHDNLSKYRIAMSRSDHTILHANLRYLDLKVPHINTGHENGDELKLMEYIKRLEMNNT